MFQKIRLLLNQSVAKSFLLLFFSTLFAQLLPVVISPILSRIYPVEFFGKLALFLAMLAILISISNGKFELVFFSIKSKIIRFNILKLCITFSFFISSFAFVVLLILVIFSVLFDMYKVDYIFLLLPFAVLFSGINQALQYFFNQQKLYKAISFNKFFIAFFIALLQILLGLIFVEFQSSALILSVCIGYLFGMIYFLKVYSRDNELIFLFKISYKRLYFVFKKFKNTFVFSFPSALINSVSLNLIVFILGLLYSPVLLGLYFMATRIINAPLTVFSSAYSSIFNEKIGHSNFKLKLYVNSFLINLVIGIIIITPFIFYGEEIFEYCFGVDWRESGYMVKILAPFVVMNFAVGSISGVFNIFLKNEILFKWQLLYIISIVLTFIIFKDSFYDFLIYYSIIGAIAYTLLFFLGLNIVRRA